MNREGGVGDIDFHKLGFWPNSRIVGLRCEPNFQASKKESGYMQNHFRTGMNGI